MYSIIEGQQEKGTARRPPLSLSIIPQSLFRKELIGFFPTAMMDYQDYGEQTSALSYICLASGVLTLLVRDEELQHCPRV